MSTKNKGIKFFTVFIILISVYYSVEVYSSREESKGHFEISNITTTFGKIKENRHGSLVPGGERKIDYNVPCMHIRAQITNLTGDDIDFAELIPELDAKFKYGYKSFTTYTRQVTSSSRAWKPNEIIKIDEMILLESYDDENKLDTKFMTHNPEKLELRLSVKASNSVGLDMNEVVFNKEINSWNVN
jgi:hypothetical protein